GVKSTFYRDADGDGYGNAGVTTQACTAPIGYVSDQTDCNDSANSVHPNAQEICFNGVDDNCNSQQDEAAECSINCNWDGAGWLSHGLDGNSFPGNNNAFLTGAWAMCSGGKLNYMEWMNGAGTQVNPAPSGTTDNVVGCNWGVANRWASQGWDG